MRSLAPMELLGMGRVWVARTDVGGVGVVRRPFLTKIAKFCQGLVHLRLEHVDRADPEEPDGGKANVPSAVPYTRISRSTRVTEQNARIFRLHARGERHIYEINTR